MTINNDFSDYQLVLALSRAVRQNYKDYTPEMVAALILAMTDKNRSDLVVRSEGIYISRQCWEKIHLYDVWLATEGEIIITRKRVVKKFEESKEDNQQILNRLLPSARHLGRMNLLAYAIGLSLTFGLDPNNIILNKEGKEACIYY